jgi:hypothetical protein
MQPYQHHRDQYTLSAQSCKREHYSCSSWARTSNSYTSRACKSASTALRAAQIAAEVQELSEALKAAVAEAEYINAQEKMFGWSMTKYQHVAKVIRAVWWWCDDGAWCPLNGREMGCVLQHALRFMLVKLSCVA